MTYTLIPLKVSMLIDNLLFVWQFILCQRKL